MSLRKLLPMSALGLTIIFFSTIELVSKTITYNINPVQLNFLRFIISGFILLPFALIDKKKLTRISCKEWKQIALIGLINVSISITLLHITVMLINASLAAVLFCTNPIFTNLFESLYNRTKLTTITLFSLLISFLGITIISINEIFNIHASLIGIITGILSSVSYGFYIVYAKGVSSKVDNVLINCFSFLIGSIFLIPVLRFINSPIFLFNLDLLPQLLYLTIVATVGAYLLFIYGLKHLSAGASSLIFFLKPPLAIFLAYLFLREEISIQLIIGTALIITGMFLYSINGKNLN